MLGLETLCGLADTPDKLCDILRGFYAHETVHAWQQDVDPNAGGPLLAGGLIEGAADFIATLVTGRQIDPARAAWAATREADLWRRFEADVAVMRGTTWDTMKKDDPASVAVNRCHGARDPGAAFDAG